MCQKLKNESKSRYRQYKVGGGTLGVVVNKRIMSWCLGAMLSLIGHDDIHHIMTIRFGRYDLMVWWDKLTALAASREQQRHTSFYRRPHKVGFWD